ncbi:cell division protein FtsQ/DivIB [Clostridium thermarum]|uniref:cell division protein FtsQ/DivIB n=1 Tax=Clostridium thermarum TaxID=1716543 RepID=UPI0013D2CB91|nr:FtsQ-type POTRA domain-containing protein [Clostridium thermarum]
MGQIKKNTNELIRMRKRKKLIKKIIFWTITTLIITVILGLKLPYFNVSEIVIENNILVATEDIENLSEINIGSNIFLLSKADTRENILSNPYISDVKVKRKLPSVVLLEITERTPQYYISKGNEYVILDVSGYVLEITGAITDKSLVQLSGLDAALAQPSMLISEDSRRLQQIEVFSDLIKRNISDTKITAIDLQSSSEIKVYFNNIEVKAGSIDGMQEKLNKAINIISQQELQNLKGYIDVSYDEAPVISIEDQEE